MGISFVVVFYGVNWLEILLWGEFWVIVLVILGVLLGKDCKILEWCLIFWGLLFLLGYWGW